MRSAISIPYAKRLTRLRAAVGLALVVCFMATWPGAWGASVQGRAADASRSTASDHAHASPLGAGAGAHDCASKTTAEGGGSLLSCCVSACHAALPAVSAVLAATAAEPIAAAPAGEPSVLTGPPLRLKRPPRPSVSRIG